MNLAEFITRDGDLVSGYFEIDNRNKCHIRIESDVKDFIDNFKQLNVINCISNTDNYFFYQLFLLRDGYTSSQTTTYYIEFDAYAYGIGVYCNDLEELQIEEMCVKYTHLQDWYLGLKLFAIDDKTHLESLKQKHVGALKNDIYSIDKDLEIELQVNGTSLRGFDEQFIVVFKHKSGKYSEYWKSIIKFSRLLSLLCFQPIEIDKEITCFFKDYYCGLNFHQWVDEQSVYKPFLISYNEIEKHFGTILVNYFNNTDLDSAISTLNSSLYIQNSVIGGNVSKFLNIVRSIESMYENLLYDFSDEELEYRKNLDEIIKTIPCKKDRETIFNKLQLSHKATFKMKLTKFFNECEDIFGLGDKCKLFVNIIQQTRNYFTHLLSDTTYVVKEKNLSSINNLLLALINYRLLRYLNNEEKVGARYTFLNRVVQSYEDIIVNNFKPLLED